MTLVFDGPLLSAERDELADHEATIERGLATFVEVGNALLCIQARRLYRETHVNFAHYVKDRWPGFGTRHAYRLIEAVKAVENVTNWSQRPLPPPATESQARPLTALPPERQPEVWAKAVETATNGRVTAAHVQAVVDEVVAEEQGRVEAREARNEAHRAGHEQLAALAEELELPPVDEAAQSERTALIYPLFDAIHLLAKLPPPEEVIAAMETYHRYHLDDLPRAAGWLVNFDALWGSVK